MGLRTQVDPHILIGDALADLPPPGSVPQGTLFHELATGECRVLVEDPSNHVRRWEDFCASPPGATGATGPTGGVQSFQFSGTVTGATTGTFFGDNPALPGAPIPLRYPVPVAGTQLIVAVTASANTENANTTVNVFHNGVAVGALLTTVPAATTGTFAVHTTATAVAAGDQVDIGVATTGTGAITLAATVLVQ